MVHPAEVRNRLLVVDDEPSIRDLLHEGLEECGYRVEQAGDAAEAFEKIKGGRIDLVLSDIDMPGDSGLDLLQRVKAHDPDVDMVMVTGVLDVDAAVHALRHGASDYITKPFHLEEVRIVVERALEKRGLILENREYQLRLEQKVAERTRELREKHAEVERLYHELQDSYESTLEALITALDYRDNETHGHSRRVVEYSVVVAQQLGVKEPELTWLRRGAILHDVGKIGVPDAILHKPGKLDEKEWVEMRRHPELGYEMLRHVKFLAPALDIVLSHQERYDGSGYPRGLAGEAIPLGARVFAVVDTFDAMTSDRPYRAALTIEAARDEVRRFSGIQFDPKVAEAFLAVDASIWAEIRERVHREVGAMSREGRHAV